LTLGKQIDVVAGLIFCSERLLVCQRRRDSIFPLKWEFPGGKIEEGEAAIAALRRELKEELDIEIREAKLFCTHEHVYPDGPSVSLQFFSVREFAGEVKNLVFERILWTQLAQLERLDFLEGDLPIVQRLAKDGVAVLLDQPREGGLKQII
jgi:8-oxo-dGTP diphosphatase